MPDDPLPGAAFSALLERANDPVLLIADDQLRIVRAGAGAAALARRTVAELLGMSLIAAFGSAALDALARSSLATGAPATGEADLGALGARAFAVEVVPLPSRPEPQCR